MTKSTVVSLSILATVGIAQAAAAGAHDGSQKVRADECVVSGPLSVAGHAVYPGGTYCVPLPGD